MKRNFSIAIFIFIFAIATAGFLVFSDFNHPASVSGKQLPQFAQVVGDAFSVPACSSSSPSVTCSGSSPSVTLSWTYGGQHGTCNAVSVSITSGPSWTGLPCSSSLTWNDAANSTGYSYSVTYIGADSKGRPVTIDSNSGSFTTPNCSPPPPPTASISANPTAINLGQSSTLTWSSTNEPSCTISGIGGVAPSGGSLSVSPTVTTIYTLNCSNFDGSNPVSASATVTVNQLPGDFTLSAGGGLACNSVPLSWTASAGADTYKILRGSPRVDISRYQPYTALNFTDYSVSQNTDYQYQIEAYNDAGTNRSNEKSVTTPNCPPTLSFSGLPTSIYQGQSTTLTWSSTYTTSCTASGAWSGSKPVSGSEVVIPLPPPSVTYTMICTGPGDSTGPQSVTVDITPLALPEWKEIIPR